jgi:hypothetical protein
MRTALRLVPLLLLGVAAGCQPVREDRSIHFSGDGGQAGFQHGREGVFVVEGEGQAPRKIFQPGPEVIATSAPLWAPTDRRLVFTTARALDPKADKPAAREQDPAGDRFAQRPVRYTCWLRSEPRGGNEPAPAALFEADCDHPGYVAANLAVRWSADGKRVFYLKQTAPGRHGLFSFDLQTRQSAQVFPQTADALVFDGAPGGAALACVLGSRSGGSPDDGIWVGEPGVKEWWHVPGSGVLAGADLPALLERLRATLPAWTPDGKRFAFQLSGPARPPAKAPDTHSLHLASLADRRVEPLAEGTEPFTDLRWRPDGAVLGAVAGRPGRLLLLRPGDKQAPPAAAEGVTAFAGWDPGGMALAYVAAEAIPGPKEQWAFLFVPDPLARQALFVRAEGKEGKARRVLGGMQLTFPRWAPGDARLSLWASFRPAYHSWPSVLVELGATPDDPLAGLRLRSGDPALLVDPATGTLSWKAVDAREKDQVGHYHLLRREYAEAWRWYAQADAEGQPAAPAPGPGAGFFHYYCLEKLGRGPEAAQALRRFEQGYLDSYRAARKAPAEAGRPPAPFGAADLEPSDEQLRHWRDLYEAEVFLALDAREDGEAFFRRALAAAAGADRLRKALVLSQFLLLAGKHAEYAELATQTVLPDLLRSWKARTPDAGRAAALDGPNALLAYGDGLALVPLAAPRFLAGLEDGQVRSLLPRWQKARALADDDVKRLAVDLLLEAGHRRLGQAEKAGEIARRLSGNPARAELLGDKGVDGLVENLRQAPAAVEALRQWITR